MEKSPLSSPLLKATHISKRYSRVPALDGVHFEVPEHSITGVIGPNGAGKSTLLRVIAGFERPDAGEISYSGVSLRSFREKMAFLTYMPEHLDLYPDYSVAGFLEFIHNAAGCSDPDLRGALQLDKVTHRKIRHLSKGYHQRLKLYAALCNAKGFVVLDEPFDGFDPIQILELVKLLRRQLVAGRTFLLSIHQLHDAEKVCDQFVLLDEGRVVADGTLAALRQRFESGPSSLEEIFFKALQ